MGQRTGNYMNWVNVTVTPMTTGATAIVLTEVTDVTPTISATNVPFYGDNRRFPKMLRPTEYTRGLSITTGDVGTANSVPVDVPCVVQATLCDAKNGAGTGAITYKCVNAVLKQNGLKGSNNQYGQVTLEFECAGDDSTTVDTDPFSFTVAS